jgi:two-component system NtrC family sensor kinase
MDILIAEDDSVSRKLLQSQLEKWGHRVIETTNGAEAWERFEAEPNAFPMVIADWMMPEMDGVELIRRIRARSGQKMNYVYAILLTAKAQKRDLVEGMQAGADDFIAKPFDRDELQVRIGAGERIIRLERDLAEQNGQLREAQAALVQNEKFVSVGHLALGISHEISNPVNFASDSLLTLRFQSLSAIEALRLCRDGRETIARTDPTMADELERQLAAMDFDRVEKSFSPMADRAIESLGRVREVIRNLRDFAHIEEMPVKPVVMEHAISDILAMVRRVAERKSANIEVDLADTAPVLGNPGKLKKVLLHLVMNSLQAIDGSGRITVRLYPSGDGMSAVVEVEDDGCGIGPEHLPHVFEPFYTTREPNGRGTGLGLSISYNIIREHGGTMTIVSTVGRGTKVTVTLPVANVADAANATTETTAAAPAL